MDEFCKHIKNSFKVSTVDMKKSYLKSLDELYPNIHSYKNKDALEHYRLLSIREPSIVSLTENDKYQLYLNHVVKLKTQKVHKKFIVDQEFYFQSIYKPQITCVLTARDKEIAGLIKNHCRGVLVCLSPKADYYPSIKAFMERVAKTNCKHIQSAKYYFETHAENPTPIIQCHMYVKMKEYSSKSKNTLRSYFQKRYPYMIIKMDREDSALQYKPDITYGWEQYLAGLASNEEKKANKSLDYIWREENKIPHILTL